MYPLQSQSLTLGYDQEIIIDDLNISIPKEKITVFVGSNGCGKSTLLKSFARLIHPKKGSIILNGEDIRNSPTAEVAKKLSILPQSPTAPEGMTIYQLVRMGRYPHQNWLKQWSQTDEDKVIQALTSTNLMPLKDRPVDALSGGQRQRAWIAMTLAQDTDILLLDEPTTYLDLAHQVEILDLLYDLNQQQHKTIIMVLHDLNLACRYAHHMIAVADKTVFAQGEPTTILTAETVQHVFGLECCIASDPLFGTPICIPYGKGNKVKSKVENKKSAENSTTLLKTSSL
ncbi:ABC transporter ATP-binding protein [Psychrobacter sp. I-STPA10]|uniref:ABC transporter ATP-binding protein n=1 Tax=Psychrobacter sp. I-STPA10 TaxID=2585769 RepID=UPI001E62117F|nr:ABC transporter ATP-binding protein [Psychrobacter sp. I-STPA10]